ncbi:hypothetical protein Tamer19_59900 [Cupriavidus sp. TA19]|nr:hypothetical protein Tamer19_59900 [Cupriavidus sp. TA19]
MRELQIALGLVAMGEGISVVPSSVYGLKRGDVTYKELEKAWLTCPRRRNKAPAATHTF